MKKIFTLVGLVALMAGFTACTKNQTELSGETLAQKITVSGFVRYVETGEKPDLVNPGTLVNIYYGVPDDKGNVDYALKTVAVNGDAFFKTTLGCPVGKSLKVKVQSSMYGDSYCANEEGKKVSCEAYFFGEFEASIACGSTHCFKLDMAPVANVGDDNLIQK